MSTATLDRSRLHPGDVWRAGSVGLRMRKLRASLSVLGVAIGIASMVAVLGISDSSKADLIARLDRLGTNLLTVRAGQTFAGAPSFMRRRFSKDIGQADVVVWGVPFDCATSNRPGARFAPAAIRRASAILSPEVRMTTISQPVPVRACSSAATVRACTSASALPRVPRRNGPLCGLLPKFSTDVTRIAVPGARSAPRRYCQQDTG